MEANEESVAQTSSPVKKKRRKTKRIGYKPKRAGKKVAKVKEKSTEDKIPVENEELLMSEDDKATTISRKKPVANKGKGKIVTQRINDLISEDEKKQIESHYYVDLAFVDKRKVKKNIFVDDNAYRCKLCQTTYPRLDKCQVHVLRHFNMLPYAKVKEQASIKDTILAENDEHSESLISENDSATRIPSKKSVANKSRRKFITQKVNDLISEEERKQIESYYYVDLSSINKRKVKKSIFVGDNVYRCKLCQTAYPRLDKCQVHVWRHFNMLPYVCYACDFKTLTVTSIRGHIRKFHLKLKPFKCDQCEKSYAVAVLLKEHMITHRNSSSQAYRCDYCNFACLNKRVLVAHMTKHKSEKDVLCDICGKGFYSTKKMREHRNTHEESNAIKCDICQAYVSSEKALRRHHANVHTKDYICHVCSKKCTTRKALHNHVYQVHSEGRHQCPLCPNVYKNGSMLQDHILKHQGIRKYKCEVCGKSFAQRTHVTTHMAVHDNKRHECPGCHKGFNRQDNMKVHTKNCALFLANPELAKFLTTRKYRSAKNQKKQNKLADCQPVLNASEAVNITVKVEPTLDPDINIKVEPEYELE